MKNTLGTLVQRMRLDDVVRVLFARRRVTIVVYHDPKPESLRRHLTYFAKRYRFISMDHFAGALLGKRWETLPDYPMVVTIDDGHAGNIELQDVLAEFGVRPMVYLCSQIVGTERPFWWKAKAAARLGAEPLKNVPDAVRREWLRDAGFNPEYEPGPRHALGWEEVGRLSAVADFGGHTRTHPILPQCTDSQSAEEIALCKTELEEALHRPCLHFAYPNGDHGEREVAELRRAGYLTGRSINVGWNGPGADPYRLKVIPVQDNASPPWLAAQMTVVPSWLRHVKLRLDRLRSPARGRRPETPDQKMPAI